MSEPIQPDYPQSFGRAPSSLKEEFLSHIDKIYQDVIFGTNPDNPEQRKRLENISKATSTLLWICQNWQIDPQTENTLIQMAKNLHTNMTWPDIEKEMTDILDFLGKADRRVKTLELLMQCEYLFCIHPPEGNPKIESKEFQKIINPIINNLRHEITPFHMKNLENQLKMIIEKYTRNPSAAFEFLGELKDLSARFS
jgi:hypothetical protein